MAEETLFMIEFVRDNRGTAYMVYASDEAHAWEQAAPLAIEHEHDMRTCQIIHFPHGFTIISKALPGIRQSNT